MCVSHEEWGAVAAVWVWPLAWPGSALGEISEVGGHTHTSSIPTLPDIGTHTIYRIHQTPNLIPQMVLDSERRKVSSRLQKNK